MKENPKSEVCLREDIAAYVDGELSAERSERIERHVAGCRKCSLSLREQRQFLAALSATLDVDRSVQLPDDFARRVVANAESRVSGVTRRREWLAVGTTCAVLIALSAFAFGGESNPIASTAAEAVEKPLAVLTLVFRFLANFAFAVAVIARSLVSHFSGPGSVFLACAIAVVVAFSSRRIFRRAADLSS